MDNATAAPQPKVVTEFVLYAGAGDDRQGLFSDPDESVRDAVLGQLALEDRRLGRVRTFAKSKRTCTYPLTKDGQVIASKSTCEEVDQ